MLAGFPGCDVDLHDDAKFSYAFVFIPPGRCLRILFNFFKSFAFYFWFPLRSLLISINTANILGNCASKIKKLPRIDSLSVSFLRSKEDFIGQKHEMLKWQEKTKCK